MPGNPDPGQPPAVAYEFMAITIKLDDELQALLNAGWEVMIISGAAQTFPDIGNYTISGIVWMAILRRKKP